MLAYNHIKELLPFLTYSGKCSEFYQAYPCVTNVAFVAPKGHPWVEFYLNCYSLVN